MSNLKKGHIRGPIKPGRTTMAYILGGLLSVLFGLKKRTISNYFSKHGLELHSIHDVAKFIRMRLEK